MTQAPRTLLTAAQRRQIVTALNKFYAQPVARVSFELFVTIAAVLFFAVFAIRPTLLTMSDLIKEIEEKRDLDQQLTQKIAALNTSQTVFLNLQNRLAVLEAAIPTQPEVVSALKIIEKLASDRTVAISSLALQDFPTDTPIDVPFTNLSRRTFLVNLTVTGQYPVIRQYIEDLRQNQRLFVVESVSFSTSDLEGVKVLRSTISIGVPYYGVAPAATKPAPKAAAATAL